MIRLLLLWLSAVKALQDIKTGIDAVLNIETVNGTMTYSGTGLLASITAKDGTVITGVLTANHVLPTAEIASKAAVFRWGGDNVYAHCKGLPLDADEFYTTRSKVYDWSFVGLRESSIHRVSQLHLVPYELSRWGLMEKGDAVTIPHHSNEDLLRISHEMVKPESSLRNYMCDDGEKFCGPGIMALTNESQMAKGSSGSPVFKQDGTLVGMVFAGSSDAVEVIPIHIVMKELREQFDQRSHTPQPPITRPESRSLTWFWVVLVIAGLSGAAGFVYCYYACSKEGHPLTSAA